jgi:hypothetical protein
MVESKLIFKLDFRSSKLILKLVLWSFYFVSWGLGNKEKALAARL